MMRAFEKAVRVSEIQEFGWGIMVPGKSMVTFCKCCKAQRVHQCTGEMMQDGEKVVRLECIHCHDILDGRGIR